MPSLTIAETIGPDYHAVSFTEGCELNGVDQNRFPCVDSSDEAQSRGNSPPGDQAGNPKLCLCICKTEHLVSNTIVPISLYVLEQHSAPHGCQSASSVMDKGTIPSFHIDFEDGSWGRPNQSDSGSGP